MGARERSNFELTLKGTEELAARTYRLDARARNILFLIQRGYPTVEGILENTIFPRDEVVERLRDLLRAHFVTLQAADPGAGAPITVGRKPPTLAPAAAAPPAPPPDPETEQPEQPIYFGL